MSGGGLGASTQKGVLPRMGGGSCGFGQDLGSGHPQGTGQGGLGWSQRLCFRGYAWIHYSCGSHTCLRIKSFSPWLPEEVMSHSPLAPNPGPCPRRLPCETSSLSPFSASPAIPPRHRLYFPPLPHPVSLFPSSQIVPNTPPLSHSAPIHSFNIFEYLLHGSHYARYWVTTVNKIDQVSATGGKQTN